VNSYIDQSASQDFNRARSKETFQRILNLFTPSRQRLLSLKEVKDAVKPVSESYRGMTVVPVSKIVGSEGRYKDFNKSFLPKKEYLRHRWVRVDKAHLTDTILPPIRLYEIGGVYFVRDGNHRVSVATAQGVEAIDAEVTSLGSEVQLSTDLTQENLTKAVVEYEKKQFIEKTGFTSLVDEPVPDFTATGRYDDLLEHIHGHKYYLNQNRSEEMSFDQALQSWYRNVYRPIVRIITEERILSRFPGRTASDLYVWTVRHWDQLKKKYGEAFPIEEAVADFSQKHGKNLIQRIKQFFRGDR
jgi:hypothetical protein